MFNRKTRLRDKKPFDIESSFAAVIGFFKHTEQLIVLYDF